jgi:hypothetical protein
MGQPLVDCFDNEEFRKFVTRVDPGLAGHLPEGSVARVSLVETAIEFLRRRGCVDARLFELWIEERPRRAPQISAFARRLGLDIDAATRLPPTRAGDTAE